MIKFCICDDENAETTYLSGLVRHWAAERGQAADIRCFPSAEAFLFAYADDPAVDILLLDIQMGEMDGVALAKRVRQGDKTVQIIFATSYMEYIADGYDVEALHYLIKPVDREKLAAVLDRAVGKLAQAERALVIQNGSQSVRLPLYNIRCLEVMHNYVTIHTEDGEAHRVKKPLSVLEQELDENFFRAGRSFIVNLRYVRKVTKDAVALAGGQTVPLSRGLYDKLNRAIISGT
jgi:DNA-binding LytR/AlgR family response regulator